MSRSDAAPWLHEHRIGIRHDGPVMTAVLQRDGRGNALDRPMADALRSWAERAVTGHERGDTCVAILDHAGPSFSVGGDLKAIAEAGDPSAEVAHIDGTIHEAVRHVHESDLILITVVRGVAAGAGLALAALGDLVVGNHDARFTMAYTKAGVSPDCGASWLVPRRIGHARATDMLVTNRMVGAAEAERWGLLSYLTEGDPIGLAQDLAEGVTSLPSAALRESVRVLGRSSDASLGDHLDVELRTLMSLTADPAVLRHADTTRARRPAS